jgi:hypothetical protein
MGTIKTTIELPESLMHSVRLRAVKEHKKLKDAIAEWLERGMNAPAKPKSIRLPKVAKLKNRKLLTTEEIEAAVNWGRE